MVLAAFPTSQAAGAEDDPIGALAQETLSYFTPLKGIITDVEGGVIRCDLGEKSGLKKGMRLVILREEETYRHPITGQAVGAIEIPEGKAEVTGVSPDYSTLELIYGKAEAGLSVRVPSSRVRLLFHQSKSVSWSMAEEYYDRLRESNRFDIVDSTLPTDGESEVIKEGERHGASAALILVKDKRDDATVLRQKLLWVDRPEVIDSMEAAIGKTMEKNIMLGEEFFVPKKEDLFLDLALPHSAALITSGEVNGDGEREILIGTGTDVEFYNITASLVHSGIEIKGMARETLIRLDTADMDGDGLDEVLLTAVTDDKKIVSYAYKYRDGAMRLLFKWDFFIRGMDGKVYGQKYSSSRGFVDSVFPIVHGGKKDNGTNSEALVLPPGINIYDFTMIKRPGGETIFLVFDETGFLELYDSSGVRVWRSADDLGGPVMTFDAEAYSVIAQPVKWSVKDRIVPYGGKYLTVGREPLARTARGLGYKRSSIEALKVVGQGLEETALINDIAGKVLDFAVVGKRLFVLVSPPLKAEAGRIFRGESPFVNRLYIYPLEGG